ncbi:MAG: outer membrane protein assembly factor BamB family protein [Pirellulaceae bacterium]
MHRILLSLMMCGLLMTGLRAEDWSGWRGPRGDGHSADTGFPLQWSATEHVRWKVGLPGPGNSTPVVAGECVFVSCASNEGRTRSLLCFQRESGNKLWQKDIEYAEEEPSHPTNPYCSSSPVTDGQRVIVWHGSAGLHAYDFAGALLWSCDLGKFQHVWGNGSSPVLYRDIVILNAGPGLTAFVVALDKQTGVEVWRREFPDMVSTKIDEFRGSWSTPVLASQNQQDLLLVSLPLRLVALDPLTGSDVWSCEGLGKLTYASPLPSSEAIVAMSGYHGPALAVKPGGQGDVTQTHRQWIHEETPPQRVGSGIIVDGHVYILNEPGIAWCIELSTGEILWRQRLGSGPSWSSMCYADGRIYVNNMEGTTFVLQPDHSECTVLAKNELGEQMRASLAFSQGQIFARTYENLYCLETAPSTTVPP